MTLPLRWAAVLVPGLLLYFLPLPGFNATQSHLLAIFIATIVALVSQPVAMGTAVVCSMTLLALTHTLTPAKVLSGFGNVTLWLIFTAFLFARAITYTGLGMRVGYWFIARFAHTPLTLGYALAGANLALAPFIPSDTARGGGIIFPITKSVATVFQSEAGPTARRMGTFLMLVGFHTTYTTSGMFLTGMAANPLIAEFAMKIGHVEITWMKWFLGACVPGFLTLLIVPWLLHKFFPPEVEDTEPARNLARAKLYEAGPLSYAEKWLAAIMLCVMAGWVSSPLHGIPNTFVALTGLSAMLLVGVLPWEELLAERRAWDALIWFAPLLMMSDALNELGVVKLLSQKFFGNLHGLPWGVVLFILVAAYLYIHYTFASMTAHVTALYPAFFAAALAAGVPPLLAALPLGYFSNLDASLTHYGTGSAPVFFNAGYVKQNEWWRTGFTVSLLHLVLWMGIGSLWWKALGYW